MMTSVLHESAANAPTLYSTNNNSSFVRSLGNSSRQSVMPGPMYSDRDEYIYDYEYDADPGDIPVEQLIPVSLTYGLTMVLGLLGNVLVIVSVAKFKKMQNVTNMFLLSLASADLLLVLICVPVKVRGDKVYCNCLVKQQGLFTSVTSF